MSLSRSNSGRPLFFLNRLQSLSPLLGLMPAQLIMSSHCLNPECNPMQNPMQPTPPSSRNSCCCCLLFQSCEWSCLPTAGQHQNAGQLKEWLALAAFAIPLEVQCAAPHFTAGNTSQLLQLGHGARRGACGGRAPFRGSSREQQRPINHTDQSISGHTDQSVSGHTNGHRWFNTRRERS